MNETSRIAAVARELQENDVLQKAFTDARQSALEELATVKADDRDTILRLQAEFAAIERISKSLQTMIIKAMQPRVSGLAPVLVKRT